MAGMRQAGFKAWETRLRREMSEEELFRYYQEKEVEKKDAEERKKVRDIIRQTGGLNDKDYEDIPVWAKRKNGVTLDYLVISLQEDGYDVETSNDVYKLILSSGV